MELFHILNPKSENPPKLNYQVQWYFSTKIKKLKSLQKNLLFLFCLHQVLPFNICHILSDVWELHLSFTVSTSTYLPRQLVRQRLICSLIGTHQTGSSPKYNFSGYYYILSLFQYYHHQL